MITSSVIHDTFTIERSFLATPARVFSAFASAEARKLWALTDDLNAPGCVYANYELDFRIGGWERFAFDNRGTTYRYDARYYDIVPDQRIVYSYEMYDKDDRISVSVATIEFAENGDGTALAWTEQGAFLDGIDGAAAPRLREEGTTEMLDILTKRLDARTSASAAVVDPPADPSGGLRPGS